MSNSVHTNVAALVALQGLNRTNTELQGIQNRVSTGFRVNNAQDDGAAFAIAQGLRGNIKAYEAIGEQMSKAKGLLSVANEGAKQISNTMGEIRAIVTKLADANVAGTQRTQYVAEYNALKAEIQNYITNSTFNSVNILNTATPVTVISNLTGGSTTINSQDLTTTVYNTLPAITGATTAAACAAFLAGAGAVTTAETNIGNAMATLGNDTRTLDNTLSYIGVLSDATEEGVGAIVDADLAKESARLQALQIRQQLGTQTLSIANQSPNMLLGLFQQ